MGGMDDGQVVRGLFKDQFWTLAIIHQTADACGGFTVLAEEVLQAAGKTSFDIGDGNVVATVGDPLGDPQFREFDAGQGEVDQFNLPSVFAELADELKMGAAGKSGFEGKILASLDGGLDFAEKETAGGDALGFRRQGAEPGGDEIGVDEVPATGHLWQKLQSEGRLARAIRASERASSAK